MSNTNVPFFTTQIQTNVTTLSAATAWTIGQTSTANTATLVTAGSNGCRITSIIFATTDTAANNVFLILDPSGTGTNMGIVGQVNVPLSAGTAASVLTVDGLLPSVTTGLPIDNNGKRFMHLAANDKLRIAVVANMTALKVLFASAEWENY